MGRTVLIIAHRLSTVKKADRVLVIHKGHVVEDGTPSDLLNLGGLFTSLAQHQFARTGSSLSSSCDSLSLGAESFEEDEGGEDGSFANDKLCSGSLDSGLDFSFRPTTASQCWMCEVGAGFGGTSPDLHHALLLSRFSFSF